MATDNKVLPRGGTLAGVSQAVAKRTISSTDSTQIDLLRIACIFLMVSVHVYPSIQHDTILRGGPLNGLYYVHVDILGRASVAVLSFLAGYILWQSGREQSFRTIARNRFVTLLVPMITWNLIYAFMLVGMAFFLQRDLFAELAERGVDDLLGVINAITALTDRPINLPLAFLRDLFVSVLAAWLMLPWLRRFGPAIIGLLFVIALFRAAEPLILRPAIPLFVFCGAYMASRGISLEKASDIRVVWPLGLVLLLAFCATNVLPALPSQIDAEALNLSTRALLVLGFLVLSRKIVDRTRPLDLAWLRPVVFLAFLSHAIIHQALGIAFELAGLDTNSYAYVVFFYANAPIDFAAAMVGTVILNRLPSLVQLAFRGSVQKDAKRTGTDSKTRAAG